MKMFKIRGYYDTQDNEFAIVIINFNKERDVEKLNDSETLDSNYNAEVIFSDKSHEVMFRLGRCRLTTLYPYDEIDENDYYLESVLQEFAEGVCSDMYDDFDEDKLHVEESGLILEN